MPKSSLVSLRRYLFGIAVLTCFPGLVGAALDPEVDQPYRIQVVIQIGANRILTNFFKHRIRQDLVEGLRAALGTRAVVEVIDKNSLQKELAMKSPALDARRRASIERSLALLQEVESKGFKALDRWNEVSEAKTHFVQIDYANGNYEIQSRQFDGLAGMASPVIRRSVTSDRDFVSRMAGLMIDHDFGVVGTFQPNYSGPNVSMDLKAGGLGLSWNDWIGKGDVFAVNQIRRGASGERAWRMDDTLLQAIDMPENGKCRCQLLSRYRPEYLESGGSVLGYRCLKLGTTESPLRLRIVSKDATEAPLANIQVMVNSSGFAAKPEEERVTDEDGIAQMTRPYRNVAFVILARNRNRLAQIPVEITDNRTVVCRVSANADAEAAGEFELKASRWLGRVSEKLLAEDALVRELNRLTKAKKHEEALGAAQAGLQELHSAVTNFRAELGGLQTVASQIKADQKPNFLESDRRLKDLELKAANLDRFIANVKEVIKDENDPKRQELLNKAEQARQEEELADFGKAIALYEEIVSQGGSQPALKKYVDHLQKLKQAWAIKSPEHARARGFIYETWPKLKSVEELKSHLADARKSFSICRQVSDVKSPQMLLKTLPRHTAILQKEREEHQGDNSDEGQQARKTLADVSEQLGKFYTEVQNFLGGSAPPPK